MSVCGLWKSAHRLIAVIVHDDGTAQPPTTVPATPENTRHLLNYLVTAEIGTLILNEAHHDLLSSADCLPVNVWLIPADLIQGLRTATRLDRKSADHTAYLLAHVYFIKSLRLHLRPFRAPPPHREQLVLF
jgi:hypothetical protein